MANSSEESSGGAGLVLVDKPAPHILRLTLNRPASLNALDAELVATLRAELVAAASDSDVRVVILTGAGRGFCSGMDLRGYGLPAAGRQGKVRTRLRIQEEIVELATLIRQIPVPVVAAINGIAVGGGMALALSCDIRLMAQGATLLPNFVKLGLSGGDAGLSWILPRMIGLSTTMSILMTGRSIDADNAVALSIATAAVKPEDLEAEALALAADIAQQGPLGVNLTKQLVWAGLDSSFETAIRHEIQAQVVCSMTADHREAVAAFAERRAPQFIGE
jgi:enoyl-CoA hydratase